MTEDETESITDSVDESFSKFWEIVMNRDLLELLAPWTGEKPC